VAEYFGLKETLVNEIVTYCGVVGLFDKAMLTSGRVLTSKSIQSRYIEMCNRARRTGVKIPEKFLIITEESGKLTEESGKLTEESPKLTEECDSKVKESKVKESKVKEENDSGGKNARERAPSPKNFDLRKEIFMNECAVFVEKYGKEMVRDFFDYWTEPDKSHSKMRFEMEKTWDLGRRLSAWEKNEFNFNKNGRKQTGITDEELAGNIRQGIDRAISENG
jgi:hypothetical protein